MTATLSDPTASSLSSLDRLRTTSEGLLAVLDGSGGLLDPSDAQTLARELGRLARRLDPLAEAAGLAADPLAVAP